MQIADLTASLKFDADTTGLKQVEEGTASAGAGTVALGSIIATGVTKLAELGAAAVKAAAAFAVDLVKGFAAAGDEIAKTGKRLQVSTDDLQRLDFVFKRGGASSASFTKAVRALSIGLTDASLKGTGPLAEGLEVLGLDAAELQTKGLEERMLLLSDAFRELPPEFDKAGIAGKVFGNRAGTELLPALLEGREAMDALGDKAEELGGVLGGESLASAEQLTDSFLDLETFVNGVKNAIGGQLAPKVTELTDKFTTWISENDELLTQELPEFLDLIIEAASTFLPWLIDLAVETKNFFTEIKQLDERLSEDLGPVWGAFKLAVEATLSPISVLIDLVVGVVDAVGQAVDKLASMEGVLGDVGRAINKIPIIGDGDEVPTTNVRGFAGGLVDPKTGKPGKVKRTVKPTANMSSDQLGKIANDPTVTQGARAKAAGLVGVAASREVQSAALLAQAKQTIDTVNNSAKSAAAAERAQRRADATAARDKKKGGKKGGGKGKRKASTGIPELDAILKDEAGGGSSSGGFAGAGGGGSSQPGTTINRIDQSFNAPTTISVTIPGANVDTDNPQQLAEQIGAAVEIKLRERDRRSADHFRSAIKV